MHQIILACEEIKERMPEKEASLEQKTKEI